MYIRISSPLLFLIIRTPDFYFVSITHLFITHCFWLANMLRSMISRPLVGALLALTAVNAVPQRSFVGTTLSTTKTTVTLTSVGTAETTITTTGTLLALSTSPSATTAQATSLLPQETACNNSPLLCNKTYDDVVYLGAHDSPFLRDRGTSYSIAGNQYFNATVSLSAGVRLLQAQVHFELGHLVLCHGSCKIMNAGALRDWLSIIRAWLDSNRNEVVTLVLVNAHDVTIDVFGETFRAAHISNYGYIPPFTSASNTSAWPTLGEMISANTRLVTFIAGHHPPPLPGIAYPYLLDQWQYVFETPYEVATPYWSCNLDRPITNLSTGDALEKGMLPLLNHFAYTSMGDWFLVPNENAIDFVNSPSERDDDALGRHARMCQVFWSRKPVFVLVDFWNRGPALEAVDRLNGVLGNIQGRTEPPQYVRADDDSAAPARFGGTQERAARVGLFGFVVAVMLLF
jgi:hypothetical protein